MNDPAAVGADASSVNWLLSTFVVRTPGVEGAVGVSSDGLLMAISANLDRAGADRLAAVISGLTSLSDGAARSLGMGALDQVIVEMRGGHLFVARISDGSSLGVIAARDADLGLVGYEMTLLVERFGAVLTPALIAELQSHLGVR